jgi:hypothetical protein
MERVYGILDPRGIDFTNAGHEFRIYLDDRADRYAIVDEVDYQWAITWRWNLNVKKSRRNPLKIKEYARRAVGENSNGVRIATHSVYLHTEILKRAQPEPPTPFHVICDHRNGKSLDCRRANLRWATFSMNSKNRHGEYAHDLVEG